MIGNGPLKVAASISLGIHLLFFGIASSLFQESKVLRRPPSYVRVTLLPMMTKEQANAKVILPIPLKVGNQDSEGPVFDREERNGETTLPLESITKDIPFEEPKTFPQQREEERILKEPINVAMAVGLPSGPNRNKEQNMVSSKEATSNGENLSASLPSLQSGESYRDGFSYDSSAEGLGVGKTSGNGSPGKRGFGKGTGILGNFFYTHGGGNGTRPKYAENPKPIYPQEAKGKGYEGEVVLRVEVLVNGRVGQIEIKKSSGYELLDHSALTAVKQWRFIPAKKGDVAIPLRVGIPIRFQLQ